MPTLNIFEATRERTFTYYDRCAIALDAGEMTAARVRVLVDVVGSPLSLSQNFKHPVPESWFGYAQGWFQEFQVWDVPIKYPRQVVWDDWNIHGTLAHQLTEVYMQIHLILDVLMTAEREAPGVVDGVIDLLNFFIDNRLERLFCLVLDVPNDILPPFINTFQRSVNVIRFNFPPGTVFNVIIESWNMGETEDGIQEGNPVTDEPYDAFSPQEYLPDRTPGGSDPESSYGSNPIPSSPIDPLLDPADFSNAPDPEPEVPPPTPTCFIWIRDRSPEFNQLQYGLSCSTSNPPPGYSQFSLSGLTTTTADIATNDAALEAAYPGFDFYSLAFNYCSAQCPTSLTSD